MSTRFSYSRYLYWCALSGLVFLSACSSNQIYRSQLEICKYQGAGSCSESSLQVSGVNNADEYHLGFVEYSDQGQLRTRAQMNAVLEQYRAIAAKDDVLLTVFVHGWHHSAQPEDDNISSFRGMLELLSKNEHLGSQQQGRKRRKVLGIYVGWRGDSITVPYVKGLTFWDRKNTAHDVGQQGVTELLLKLEEIVNVKTGMTPENPPPNISKLVVIGHSFGGAVLFSSLHKILVDRFINSQRGKTFSGDAEGFGDLVVLINPAFEALRFAGLYDLSQEYCRGYFASQVPKLAILTSEADYATKFAFPTGRFFSTIFESHVTLTDRNYCTGPGSANMQTLQIDEGAADRNTVGHFTPYLTHRLNPVSITALQKDSRQLIQIQNDWAGQSNADTLDFNGSRLTSLGRTTQLNPYLNIQVDKELIRNHNDIWGDQIINFISELVIISTTPSFDPDPEQ